VDIQIAIQNTRSKIQALRDKGRNAGEQSAGALAAQRIGLERFLTELLAANSRRLLNTIVEWDADGATLSGKVFQIIANPANLETAVIAAGTACHVVPVAQLRIPGGKP
jgi:hypothetical protein